MKTCPLCNINPADNKNSHIIPKFLGKPLFEDIKPRHSLQIAKGGKSKKIQDTPKQNFMICKSCEKRLEILETYFSRKLIGLRDYGNRKDKFETSEIGPNLILNCLDLNPFLFKLFCFSMIWRLSITSNPFFKNFKLPEKLELEIADFLNKNLQSTHQDLINGLELIKTYPKYHLLVYKQKIGNESFKGILTAFQMSEDHYGIFTSDMILFFYLNENLIDDLSKLISNMGTDKVKFVLANSSQWKGIGKAVIKHRLLNNSI
jgi:hypothetical protein